MTRVLLLAGTGEARAVARALREGGRFDVIASFAGATSTPADMGVRTRSGGFGGADGLARFIQAEGIDLLIDATHPFAAQMSRNAIAACAVSRIPMVALVRPPWRAQPGDNWHCVPNVETAAARLGPQKQRVFLAIGRTEIKAFLAQPQHHYLLRFVDAPVTQPSFPDHEIIVARGPFDAENDAALLQDHRVDIVVSKNSGGAGARAKIDAARRLELPVVMIDRPPLPRRNEVATVEDVVRWLSHPGTERGV